MKKISILPTEERLKEVSDTTFQEVTKGQLPFNLAAMEHTAGSIRLAIAREVGQHMWKRLVELGMLHEGHDCTQYERTGHSPDHSPACRTCRAKKELGL